MITLHKLTSPIFFYRATLTFYVLLSTVCLSLSMSLSLCVSHIPLLLSHGDIYPEVWTCLQAGLLILAMSHKLRILKHKTLQELSYFTQRCITKSLLPSPPRSALLNFVHVHSLELKVFWFSRQTLLLMIYCENCSLLPIFSVLSNLNLERASMHF